MAKKKEEISNQSIVKVLKVEDLKIEQTYVCELSERDVLIVSNVKVNNEILDKAGYVYNQVSGAYGFIKLFNGMLREKV